MGEATRAIGKLVMSIMAGAIVGSGLYNSLKTFKVDEMLGFPYASEVISFFLGFVSMVLIYALSVKLKHQL